MPTNLKIGDIVNVPFYVERISEDKNGKIIWLKRYVNGYAVMNFPPVPMEDLDKYLGDYFGETR